MSPFFAFLAIALLTLFGVGVFFITGLWWNALSGLAGKLLTAAVAYSFGLVPIGLSGFLMMRLIRTRGRRIQFQETAWAFPLLGPPLLLCAVILVIFSVSMKEFVTRSILTNVVAITLVCLAVAFAISAWRVGIGILAKLRLEWQRWPRNHPATRR